MSEVTLDSRVVRESPIAGTWYPGQPDALRETIGQFLASAASPPVDGDLVALVSPHAGYMYSGQVAAYAYHLLTGRHYDLVAVVSPSHRLYTGGLLVTRKSYYRTPLGLVEVAADLVAEIGRDVRLESVARDEEHSLEIQLPFLQFQLGSFRLIPIMMEDQSYVTAKRLGAALARIADGRNMLLVASTDLSHFHDYERAVALDRRALESISHLDPEGLDRDVNDGRTEACGYGAVVAVLLAAKALGADKATVLHYANSGDVTGDRSRVVGYGAVAVTRSARG